MRLHGLGSSLPSSFADSDACGVNPCNWWDDVYARDACIQFLECAYPNDPTTIGFEKGAIVGAAAAAGQAVGGAVNELGSGLASGLTGGGDPTKSSLGSLVIISVALLGAVLLLKK